MVTVEFMGPIGREPMQIEADSVAALASVLNQDPSLSSWLESSAIAVNDEMVLDKNYPLKAGDRVLLLPPVCGG